MNGETKTYPGCSFPLSSLRDTEEALSLQLERRTPFSMIRLGDGEGAVLSRPAPEDAVLWKWARRQLGAQITSERLSDLADHLREAIDTADLIGIRDDIVDVCFPDACFSLPGDRFLERFASAFHLRPVERGIAFPGALRIALTHKVLGEYRFSRAARFCSAWLHFHLSSSGALVRYLAREDRPALISGHVRLATEMQRFLRKEIDYYRLPMDYPSDAGNQPEHCRDLDSYVEEFRRTTDLIDVKYPGQLFLVGGGAWSKAICSRVKQRGGIALDVGSVCDAWIGMPSRPMVYSSMFKSAPGAVPDSLLLSVQIEKSADHE